MSIGGLHLPLKNHVMIDLQSSPDSINLKNNKGSDTAIEAPTFAAKASEFHGHRAIKIWMLVMLSMGHRPTSGTREKLLQERILANEFRRRVRFIRANLTTHTNLAAPNILYFNNHPSSELFPENQDKYVDVVSALQALRGQFGPLPQPVDELALAAANLPVPRGWHDGAEEAGADSGEGKRLREDKSSSPRVDGNASRFIRALLELHHGLPERKSLSRLAKDIMAEFEKAGVKSGLGEHAIKTQLENAFSVGER